jgi:hypothetical protein
LAVIQAEAVNQLETESLESLIEQFVNDVWWFDQAACSSPRTLVWVGEPESTTAAREKFLRCLSRRLEIKRLGDDSAMAVQRRVALYGLAIENPQTQLDFQHHRFSFASFVPRPNSWLGAGAFVEIFLNQLCELSQFLNERDQTLTYFGVSSSELTDLVDDLQGTAIERIVPIGRALSFGRIWDGYNLLVHMTKSVSFIDIKSSAESRNR